MNPEDQDPPYRYQRGKARPVHALVLMPALWGALRASMTHSTKHHSPEHEEEAALYALQLLEGEERAAFEAHLASCARCQQLVADDRDAVELLAEKAPLAEAPPGFRDRLMAQVDHELAAAERRPPLVRLRPPRQVASTWSALRAWAAPLAAVLILGLAAGFLAGRQYAGNQVLLTAPLQGSASPGSATVVVHANGTADLELSIPDPPPGWVYQGWVVDSSGTAQMAGTYDDGDGTYKLERPALGQVFEVTEEPAPGSQVPTSAPLFSGQVAP